MNPHDDQQLEMEISRELKALPELTAPSAVASRVMAVIERRLAIPWYRRSWESWPAALQVAFLAAMLLLFVGLCLAGWEFYHSEAVLQSARRAGHWFNGLSTLANLINVLADSVVLVFKKLGTTFTVACLVIVGLGYAVFMGFGTLYFRLAWAKR